MERDNELLYCITYARRGLAFLFNLWQSFGLLCTYAVWERAGILFAPFVWTSTSFLNTIENWRGVQDMSSLSFIFVTVTHSPSSFHLLIHTQSQFPTVVSSYLLFCWSSVKEQAPEAWKHDIWYVFSLDNLYIGELGPEAKVVSEPGYNLIT